MTSPIQNPDPDLTAILTEITSRPTERDSLVSIGSDKPLILNDVLLLITDMLESLQKTAIVQSNRIRILTQWQSAYTDLIGQVPLFTNQDGTAFGTNLIARHTRVFTFDNSLDLEAKWNQAATEIRGDQNSRMQAMTEFLRGERSIVADEAKVLQTAVNQSNDAVTQQANMATSIVQQLSTILQSIFR